VRKATSETFAALFRREMIALLRAPAAMHRRRSGMGLVGPHAMRHRINRSVCHASLAPAGSAMASVRRYPSTIVPSSPDIPARSPARARHGPQRRQPIAAGMTGQVDQHVDAILGNLFSSC
jgi:hypothetical protein